MWWIALVVVAVIILIIVIAVVASSARNDRGDYGDGGGTQVGGGERNLSLLLQTIEQGCGERN